jgi:aliphatic sulfonates family ABC transporter substrate-binding protein
MHDAMKDTGGLSRRALAEQVVGVMLAGCAPATGAPTTLNIGYQKNGVLLLARSRGVVEALMRPIKLNWVEFPSGPPLLEAMNAGAIDLGATGDTPPIFAQAAGSALQYVAFQPISGDGEALLVPANSPIRRVAELKGKRVAFTKGSSSHLLTANALASAGLTLAEVKPIYLSPSDAASAFGRGAVDAWAIWDPFLALAERDQKARILIAGTRLPRTDAFYLASDRIIAHAPKVLDRLLDALHTEAAWGEAHQPDLVKIVSAANGLPPDIVEISLRRGPLAVEPLTRNVLARQQAAADTLQDLGAIPHKIRVADAAWPGWRQTS